MGEHSLSLNRHGNDLTIRLIPIPTFQAIKLTVILLV